MNTNEISCEILIIGAGPAGSLLAFLLSNQGFEVVVVEARSRMDRKLCGEYLCPAGVDLLKDLEILHLVDGFEKVKGMKIHVPDGRGLKTDFLPDGRFEPYGVCVNREIFDSRFVDLVAKKIRILMGERVLGLEEEKDSVSVKTSKRKIQAKLVVGADGCKSVVSKKINQGCFYTKNRVALQSFLRPIHKREPYGEMHIFENGSYMGLNPIHDGEMNASIVCHSKELLKYKNMKDFMKVKLSSTLALKDRFEITGEVRATFPVRTHVQKVSSGRMVLVGDAGGFYDPLTGEGMYVALQTSRSLAGKIDSDRKVLENPNSFFAAYQREKKSMFGIKPYVSRGFQWLISKEWLLDILYEWFYAKQRRCDVLVSLIGNIYTPEVAFRKVLGL